MKKSILFIFPLFTLFFIIHTEVHAESAEKGIFTIEQLPKDERVPLNGEWEFYWMKLYTPTQLNENNTSPLYIKIPEGPNGFNLGNGKIYNTGYATYRLKLKFPKEEIGSIKALFVPSIASAYTLWIDGKIFEKNGTVGTTKESMVPDYKKKIVTFPVQSDTVELVIQVSNFNQRKAGIFSPIYLGEYKTIAEYQDKNLIYRTFMVASFIIIGLYHLVLYLFVRKEKALLFFSCSVFLFAIRTISIEEDMKNYFLPFLGWDLSSKIEYISFSLAILFFAYFVFTQYPKEVSNKARNFIAFINLAFCLFVLLTPVMISTKFIYLLEFIGVLTVCYIIFINFLAFKNKRQASTINAIGTIIILLFGINDIFMYNGIINTIELSSFGLVFFIFTQMFIISKKYSKSFEKNEQYAKELAILNESLEQKVQARTEELNKTNEQLIAVNKKLTEVYESNKKLINNISHEIRTPLTTIQTYTKGMLDGVLELKDDYLKLVYQKGIDLSRILDDLVSLSDIEHNRMSFKFEKVDISEFCKQIYERLKLVFDEQGITFIYINNLPSSAKLFVQLDKTRIEQVINNLVNNAKRYIDKEKGRIIFRLDQKDNHILLSVEDNGIGISENDLKHIFDRFYSRQLPTSNYHGAGLGLTISKEIVERHRGKIWAESVYGEGATFYIQLPIDVNL